MVPTEPSAAPSAPAAPSPSVCRTPGAGRPRYYVTLPRASAAALEKDAATRGEKPAVLIRELVELRYPADVPGGSLRSRVLAAMEKKPDDVFTAASLAPAVGSANKDSVRNVLSQLAAEEQIERVGKGRYRAKVPATSSAEIEPADARSEGRPAPP